MQDNFWVMTNFPTSHNVDTLKRLSWTYLPSLQLCSDQQIRFFSFVPESSWSWVSHEQNVNWSCCSVWNIGWCFQCCCCDYHTADRLSSPPEMRNWVIVYSSLLSSVWVRDGNIWSSALHAFRHVVIGPVWDKSTIWIFGFWSVFSFSK